ncbi:MULTISPECIES: peptidoglycan D,D-transpeptidase FtsI family protein [Methylocaldum]|jgi:cell division protein FtsI (penicillin-binding protein 3)|uniref:peptidoglycan D,D-transpeptidase FtsI family protein n=1 Tax=unclassified Methylocaldum TaxID=2622260 RepID=UPI00098B12AB|nr:MULTISPECIES: penicillin-binding transpeptidase domain-containing protein [unclassified Methylocaldum]MBP1148442.1 cell division protein FtsI (penicillin-binding protein 3) [Methylocaldum sp. RMAD-M]
MLIIQPRPVNEADYSGRWYFLLIVMLVAMTGLIGRAVYLQVLDRQFLKRQGDLRHVGILPVPAHRGRIFDRNGELLAISTPVKSIWVNPKEFREAQIPADKRKALADLLGLSSGALEKHVGSDEHRSFAYLKRRISPELADQVIALGIAGVYSEREYRRYYPTGEVAAHLVGFTNIDDKGQEAMELAYDDWLKGVEGAKRIIRDGKRRVIEDLESIRPPVPGKDLALSIDQRLQYLAYRELKKAVLQHQARSGSLALLDTQTGEVLAIVNQPSYNPNSRTQVKGSASRNRAITDIYEPGSTMKPFVVALGLELGLYRPDTVIDTAPGTMRVGHNIVKDIHNYGVLDVAHVLQKSSNVGVTKIALNLPSKKFWAFYNNLGFGQPLETGFPGEANGRLADYQGWSPFEQATLSFGYGVSASTLQLARAYLSLANDGVMPMVSLVKRNNSPELHRIMSAQTAGGVRAMLEQVVTREGTALKAAIPGFRVAGKTGTVKKSGVGGYSSSRYLSVFAGMAPASKPRLVMVVMIDEPSAGEYYGGAVAAPVFSRVMEGALRLLNIAPDQGDIMPILAAQQDEPA